jgi:2,3-bisphosphoglycerate-independent phosphoglycerate mutase
VLIVPLLTLGFGLELREGSGLSDLVPTCLDLLGLAKPAEMTGSSVVTS